MKYEDEGVWLWAVFTYFAGVLTGVIVLAMGYCLGAGC